MLAVMHALDCVMAGLRLHAWAVAVVMVVARSSTSMWLAAAVAAAADRPCWAAAWWACL